MAELKPCPFCGKSALLIRTIYRHEQETYFVKCGNFHDEQGNSCRVIPQTYEYKSEEHAIEAWNTRIKESEVE